MRKSNQVNFFPGDSKSVAEERADEIAQDIERRAVGELFGPVPEITLATSI